MPTLAETLDAERQAQALSLNELARRAALSPGRVHAILTGGTPNPGILTVLRVLAALGRDLRWLHGRLRCH